MPFSEDTLSDLFTQFAESSATSDSGDYFKKPGLSSTRLKAFLKHPLYFNYKDLKENEGKYQFGSLLHALIEKRTDIYIDEVPSGKMFTFCSYLRNREINDETLDEAYIQSGYTTSKATIIKTFNETWRNSPFVLQPKGLYCTQEDYDTAIILVNRIKKHPIASTFLSEDFETEKEYFVDYNNFDLKAKMDKVNSKSQIIVDWKTCITLDSFEQNYYNYGYDIQADFYSFLFLYDKYKKISPLQEISFYFVALQKTPPYPIRVYEARLHTNRIDKWLADLQQHIDTNYWESFLEEQIHPRKVPPRSQF